MTDKENESSQPVDFADFLSNGGEIGVRLVIDNIPQFVFWKDINSVYLGCNRNFALAAGVGEPENIIGKTDFDLAWRSEEAEFFRECDRRVMENDRAEYHIIEPQRHADGKQAWLDTSKIPLHDANGKVIGILGTYEDITERRLAEEALRESEDRYRDLVESSQDLICTHTLSGHILSINPRSAQLLGYTQDDLLGMNIHEILAPEVRHELKEYLDEIKTKGVAHGLMLVQTKEGERRIWKYNNTLRAEGLREPIVRGMAHDVTEQIRAEKELRLSAETFKNTFYGNAAAMAMSRIEDGTLLDVNERWLELVGLSREEVIGRTAGQHGRWKNLEERRALVRDLKRHGAVRDRECKMLKTNGEEWTALMSARVITVGGEPVILSSAIDISERKRVEQELRATRTEALNEKNRLEAVMEALPVGVAIIDCRGGIIKSNPGYEQVWGSPRPEARTVGDYAAYNAWWVETGRMVQAEEWASARAIQKGERVIGQLMQIARFDGNRAFVHNSAAPVFDAEGRIAGCAVAIMDITQQIEAELAIKQSRDELELRVRERTAALEKANDQLRLIPSRLIAAQEAERKRLACELHDSIAQDLVGLKYGIESVLTMMGQGHNEEALQHLDRIVPILQRSIEETRAIYMGLRPSVLEDIGLIAAIKWLKREFNKLYPEHHIELEMDISEDDVSEILKISIFRIYQEALNNVVKHSKAQCVNISLAKNGTSIELVVADDGVGMDLSYIESSAYATSLGLTSMRERAELTSGSFAIASIPGVGTTIRSVWPNRM